MSVIHVVYSPISGIVLEQLDEVELGPAKIFSNPAAQPFLNSLPVDLQRIMTIPNVQVPHNSVIDGLPPAPFDSEVRLFGIARYILEIEIEMPTNSIQGQRISEELEWAVLPLRISGETRILTGLSPYCSGGGTSSGLAGGGSRERLRREGLLASAPLPRDGYLPICALTKDNVDKIGEFAILVNRNRKVISGDIGEFIDAFSKSFYLPSHTDRGMNLLIALEGLFVNPQKEGSRGISDKVKQRVSSLFSDRIYKLKVQHLVGDSFKWRKDIEHGKKAKGPDAEKYFAEHIQELENVVRRILFQAVNWSEQNIALSQFLPGLN